MRYRCCGWGVALIVALLAGSSDPASLQSAPAPETHRGEPNSMAESSGVRPLQKQTGEQTVLRAFFELPKASCFAMNGMLKLGASKIELAFAFAPGMSRVF